MKNMIKRILCTFTMLGLQGAPQIMANVVMSGDDESACSDNGCGYVVGYTSPGSLVVDGGSVFTGPGSSYPNGTTIIGLVIGFYAGADHSSVSISGSGSETEGGSPLSGYPNGWPVNVTIGHYASPSYSLPPGNSNSLSISAGGFLNGGISCFGNGSSILVTDPGSHIWGGINLGGSDTSFVVQNGAVVDNGTFDFTGDSNNVVLVTGTNTVCNNFNGYFSGTNCSMTFSHGAQANAGGRYWGFFGGGGNKMMVDGIGTSVTVPELVYEYDVDDQLLVSGGAHFTADSLNAMEADGPCQLVVTDFGSQMAIGGPRTIIGGLQFSVKNGAQLTFVGDIESGGGNTLLVSGIGSQLLMPTNTVFLGYGFYGYGACSGDQIVIQSGGLFAAANLYLVSPGNSANVAGSLFVTNSTGTGTLGLGGYGGVLAITGTVVSDLVSLHGSYYHNYAFGDGPGGPVTFSCGTLMTKGLGGNNNQTFIVGDGTNNANYVMQGGTHSFVNGLVISSNSVLSGCGTVTGSVTNYGLIILTNGCNVNFSGPVVNYGTILALNGTAYFNSTFVNNGTFVQTPPGITGLTFSGNDVGVQFNTVSNSLHDLQFNSDLTSGIWTTLTNGLLGTGNPMLFTDSGSRTNAQRFYRVLFHY